MFGFHPKCRNLRITHLAYADDLLIFSKGDAQIVSLIMNCLNNFGDMAGLRVNQMKSNIYMTGVDDYIRHCILNVTGFSSGELSFRYLGIPLASRKLKVLDFGMLLDTISGKIKSWHKSSLSHAGKLELIRAVLQGVECFCLSIIPMQKHVLDDIRAMCRKFVWPTKHPLIAWDILA